MTTQQKTVQQNLLDARKEALHQANHGALRPLGKWKGMDVFTWHHPKCDELVATLKHFPFPVYWLTNAALLEEVRSTYPELIPNLKWIGQFDKSTFPLTHQEARSLTLVSATETIDECLVLLDGMVQPKHVVLITVNGGDWVHHLARVEEAMKRK